MEKERVIIEQRALRKWRRAVYTPISIQILRRIILDSNSGTTINTIREHLKLQGYTEGKTTVYETIDKLLDAGILVNIAGKSPKLLKIPEKLYEPVTSLVLASKRIEEILKKGNI